MEALAAFDGGRTTRNAIGALLVLLALVVGSAGGYVAAALKNGVAPSHVATVAARQAGQQAAVPGYVQQEIAQAAREPRLSQDSAEFIARYGQHTAVVPDWILGEITPAAAAPRLSQDSPEFIAMYARPSYVPGDEYATR